jgi:hypothetical protein
MKVKILSVIQEILHDKFIKLLSDPLYEKVNYQKNSTGYSYSLFEYSEAWSQFVKFVNDKMLLLFDDPNGVFTRKRSKAFLSELENLVQPITAKQVVSYNKRYTTMFEKIGTVEVVNLDEDEFVACDFCNEGEDTMGGVIVGGWAICGDCSKDLSHPEEIDEVLDPEKTFRENVLAYRRLTGQTENRQARALASQM